MKVAREQFDKALVKDLAFYRSNGRTGKEWWTARPEVAKLLLPIDSIRQSDGPAWSRLRRSCPTSTQWRRAHTLAKKLVWPAQRNAHLKNHTSLVEEAMQLPHELPGLSAP